MNLKRTAMGLRVWNLVLAVIVIVAVFSLRLILSVRFLLIGLCVVAAIVPITVLWRTYAAMGRKIQSWEDSIWWELHRDVKVLLPSLIFLLLTIQTDIFRELAWGIATYMALTCIQLLQYLKFLKRIR